MSKQTSSTDIEMYLPHDILSNSAVSAQQYLVYAVIKGEVRAELNVHNPESN